MGLGLASEFCTQEFYFKVIVQYGHNYVYMALKSNYREIFMASAVLSHGTVDPSGTFYWSALP